MARRKTITETIRKAIEARGISGYQLEKEAGLSQGAMSRFLRGKQNVGGATIDVLCEYLDLELVERKKKK